MLNLAYHGLIGEAYSTGCIWTGIKGHHKHSLFKSFLLGRGKKKKEEGEEGSRQQSENSSYPVFVASFPEIHRSVL